jgi:hypothetical protein
VNKILITALIILSFGCKNQNHEIKDLNKLDNESQDIVIIEERDNRNFENQVFQCMEEIENSDSLNRRSLIDKFISYGMEIDGAIGEMYFNFAYEYPLEYPKDFFSVFKYSDTLIIKNWAYSAGAELNLFLLNSEYPEAVYKDLDFRINESYKYLNKVELKLANYYYDKVLLIPKIDENDKY